MPGLTLVSGADPESVQPFFQTALDPSLGGHHHGTSLWSSTTLKVGATTYPGYPLHTVETSEYWMCLEGGLYGLPPSQRRTRLMNWSKAMLGPASVSIPRSLRHTDGDFIFVACQKSTSEWTVVNDIMGRLPLYLYTPSNFVCLTRDFHLFNRLPDPPPPDRLGAAQQLTFGYPLGRHTLRKNVDRVPPGTVLRSSPSNKSTVRQHRITSYNFDVPRRHADRSAPANARELVERLDEDAKARCQWSDGPSILALSGGLDSRSIACSLTRTDCSFEATTFARPNARNASDVDYAKQIAACFDLSHDTISLPSRTNQHLRALLRAKGGLNPFGVIYMIPYLETLSARYGDGAHLLTGNGGALLRDLQPSRPLRNGNDLLKALLDKAWLDPETAAKLVRVRPERLLNSIRERLVAYPESSLRGQYVHFAFERLFKYSFEGEDRNRSYLWSSAPYHGLHFTRYALHCPYAQKENYRLYRAFLRALSERTLQIGYSNFYGLQMTSVQYNLYRTLRWVVRRLPRLKNWLKQQQGRSCTYDPDASVLSILEAYLSSDCDVLNPRPTTHLLTRPQVIEARTFDNILTVALSLCPASWSLLSAFHEQ